MTTSRIVLVAMALLVVVGEGLLVANAWTAIGREAQTRHDLLVERVRAELDRSLADVVEDEDARPFTHWRHLYVPEGVLPGMVALAVSPLAAPPAHPAIVGYAQIDPDGSLHGPALPRDEELLRAAEDWNDNGASTAIMADIARRLGSAQGVQVGSGQQVAQAHSDSIPQQQGDYVQVEQFLNRRLSSVPARSNKTVGTGSEAVRNFSAPEAEQEQVAVYNSVLEADQIAAVCLPQSWRETAASIVDISPFQAGSGSADSVVLQRRVRINDETWQQAVIFDRGRLQRWLEAQLFRDGERSNDLVLRWDGGQPLVEPFSAMAVDIDVLAGQAAIVQRQREVLLAGVAVMVMTLAGIVALALGSAAALRYARRRSDFVAAVTHELKTPLTAIRLHGEMLRDGLVQSEKVQGYHQRIVQECERLSRLIGNVLDLARLERRDYTVHPVIGDPAMVVADAVRLMETHVQAHGFSVEIRTPADGGLRPLTACFDRDALTQVVINLIDNAVKFAAGGDRRIIITLAEVEGRIHLHVADHGPGLADRDLHRMFTAFWRGGRELTRTAPGSGIGLALVRGLITAMGGDVWARNRKEGGLEVVCALRAGPPV